MVAESLRRNLQRGLWKQLLWADHPGRKSLVHHVLGECLQRGTVGSHAIRPIIGPKCLPGFLQVVDKKGEGQGQCVGVLETVNCQFLGFCGGVEQTRRHPGVFPVYVLADDHCVHDGEDPGPPVVVLFHLFEIGKESSDLR